MSAAAATNPNATYNFKVVLLGEGCVGKTSLLLRYIEDKFNDRHLTTLQVSYRSCYLMLYLCISVTNYRIFTSILCFCLMVVCM